MKSVAFDFYNAMKSLSGKRLELVANAPNGLENPLVRYPLELLAKTLLERETMDGRDVAKLVGIEINEPKPEDTKPEEPAKEEAAE